MGGATEWHLGGATEGRAMSLIRVRRDRKKNWIDKKAGWSPRRLVILLVALLAAMWYLGVGF